MFWISFVSCTCFKSGSWAVENDKSCYNGLYINTTGVSSPSVFAFKPVPAATLWTGRTLTTWPVLMHSESHAEVTTEMLLFHVLSSHCNALTVCSTDSCSVTTCDTLPVLFQTDEQTERQHHNHMFEAIYTSTLNYRWYYLKSYQQQTEIVDLLQS